MKPIFKIPLILLLMAVGPLVHAQRTEIKRAENLYENGDYFQALAYYQMAVDKGDDSKETKLQMARCHFHLKDNQSAFDIYVNLENELKEVVDIENFASCWQQLGAYEEAIAWFEKGKKAGANPLDMNEKIKACKWAAENQIFDRSILVNPADLLIGGQSFGIQFYKDKVVYSGEKEEGSKKIDNTGKGFLNLYASSYNEGTIADDGAPFSKYLEYDFHIGATAFTSNFNRIYYTKVVKVKGGSRIKIFTAEWDGKDWANEKLLSINSDEFDVSYPSVSPDDKFLYFTSSQRGGFGGQDIYKALISSNGDVGRPENLGFKVNTFGDEQWPYVSKEGKLYFASDGHLGFGGLDIFEAENVNGQFTNVRNLGLPINSGKDDFGYVLSPDDQSRGFLSSNRIGSGTMDGVFAVSPSESGKSSKANAIPIFDEGGEVEETPEPVKEPVVETPVVVPTKPDLSMFPKAFATQLTSTFNGDLIGGADVVITDANTGELVAKGKTAADGKISLTIPDKYKSENQEFEIQLSKGEQFNSKRMIVHIMEIEDINSNGLSLTPIFDDTALNEIEEFVIPYQGNQISEEGKRILDKLAAYLQLNPNVVVKLNGHTEAKGNKYQNLDDSQSIAEQAEKYLMSKGINDENMIPRGYGERYLLNKCKRGVYCEQKEHSDNRRIEVVVWKMLK